MTGNGLKALRLKTGLCQAKFYIDAGYHAANANPVENYYGDKPIPPKLEEAIRKKYKKQIKEMEA